MPLREPFGLRGFTPFQLGAGVTYSAHAFTATGQLRVVGSQFEDDLNTLKLDRYAVVDASVSRMFPGQLTVFVAMENLFDARFATGKTPVATTPASTLTTIGWPRTFRVGIRQFLP